MVRVQPYTPANSNALTRSEARAAQRRRRTSMLIGVIVVLAVAIAAVFGLVFSRGFGKPEQHRPNASGECLLPTGLRITADPAVAKAIEAIIADASASGSDCADVTVRSEDSAVTAAALVAGPAPDFDVWVPDSAMWPARVTAQAKLAGKDGADLVVSDPVASTPIVFAATDATAGALGDGAGFASLAGRKVAAVMPDPAAVGSSSAALLALQTAVGGDARRFTALVLGLDAAGVVPTTAEALAAAASAHTPTIAVTTEQAVLNAAHDPQTPLVPIYPADVKASVGIPFVTRADASDKTVEAVKALTAGVAGGSAVLAEHGLRDAAGTAPKSVAKSAGVAAAPVDGANQAEALRTWQVLTAPSRMLSLNDVSGSMLQPVTAHMRRIDLFEEAAVRAVGSLSDDSSLAMWVFSSRRIGGQDWQEVVPFGPLSDPVHKQKTIATVKNLDRVVGGGTGLYDSVLAAVKYMRKTYVPGQVNLVLLNTDGVNESDDGLDLPGLLAELKKLRDPTKPVVVIAIGYGPDTDQSALQQIAAATDGAAYQALKPTDIGKVLIDAVTQRGCRPNCG